MSDVRHTRLLIIGSGPAGYTAAVYGARAMLEPILIQGIQPGGQLTITTEVENWPGDVEVQGPGADGAHGGARQGDRGGARLRPHRAARARQAAVHRDRRRRHGLYRRRGDPRHRRAGASGWGCASEEKYKGFGVSACATCDGFFYRGREVVVIGGGNSAVEEALFLTNFASKVTLVHRRDELRAEKILQERLFRASRRSR